MTRFPESEPVPVSDDLSLIRKGDGVEIQSELTSISNIHQQRGTILIDHTELTDVIEALQMVQAELEAELA